MSNAIPDYQLRVLEERDALAIKLRALETFMASDGFANISENQVDLLIDQVTGMRIYLTALNERLDDFGIKYKNDN